MLIKVFLNFIFIFFLSLVQLSFIGVLPLGFNQLNLIIVALIFILALSVSMKSLWLFLMVGFMFDLYSLFFLGFFTILWPLVFLFARFLFVNFFTNRSLYSFLFLNLLTITFYFILSHLVVYLYKIFNGGGNLFLLEEKFWLDFLAGIIVNSFLILILFYIFNFLSTRFRPVFIWKDN